MGADDAKKPGNADDSLHLRDYFAPFREKRIEAGSLFCDRGRRRTSLAGKWRHTVDQYDTCLRALWYRFSTSASVFEAYGHLAERYGVPKLLRGALGSMDWLEFARRSMPFDFDFEHWDEIELPCCWNLARPEYFWYEGPMVFTRIIKSEARKGERTFLRIGGANYRSVLFLNGRHLGTHFGGSGDFAVDITDCLEKGDNRLIISVDSTRRPEQIPMDNTDWFNYGGIYRDIELVYVPELRVKDFFLRLVPGSLFSRIACDVEVAGPDGAPRPCGEALLAIRELGVELRVPVKDGRGSLAFEAKPELWSPESPRLYEVEVSFPAEGSGLDSTRRARGDRATGGAEPDRVADRVGFREIAARDGRVLLNGEDILLKGVSMHEDCAERGKAVSGAELRANFALAREMGCNFVRLAHYPHSREAALLADELGLMLWEEIPVYWAIDFENPAALRDARNQLAELVLRDRNRASVVIWSVGNENADLDERLAFMSELVDEARSLDGSRLVTAACLYNPEGLIVDDRLAERLDVVGLNEYFGWYVPGYGKLAKIIANSRLGKPVIISEFGADGRLGHHGSRNEFFTIEKQTEVYEEQVKAIGSIPEIRGSSPWILFDFRSPRRTGPLQSMYNRKGLVDETRKLKKPALEIMKGFYRRWKP
jgi:beta-glucuronidase